MKVREIPIEKIFTKKNVRFEEDGELGELMESMEHHELLQPVGIFPRGDRYELVWGHRRFAAAKLLNEQTIACRILEGISESDIPLIKLQENIQRKQLSAEEIVAAADELKSRRPELGDHAIDKLLGKRPGYLSFYRNVLRNVDYLRQHGFKPEVLKALSNDEIQAMRLNLKDADREPGTRKSTYHRGARLPKCGFRVVDSPGPEVVVICSCRKEKLRVKRWLGKLAGNGRGGKNKGGVSERG